MFTRQEKFLLAILAFVQFSHIVDFMIVMPLGPKLIHIFGIDAHQFGMIVSVYTFCAGVSGLLASLFIDKFDRKKLLQFFFIGFSIGTIACGMAPRYEILIFCRAFTGFFGGVLGSIILSIMSDKIDYARRGTAMGILSTSFSLASVLGVPFSLYLADHFNWHAPFYFLGVLCVIASIILQIYFPSMRDHLELAKSKKTNSLEDVISFFKDSNQRRAIIFTFFMLFGHFALVPFISNSLVLNAGFAESQLPLVYLFGGIASVIVNPSIGRFSDKIGKHNVFAMALIASLIPIFLITHLPDGLNMWFVLAVTTSFFIMAGARMVPSQAMVSQVAPAAVRGSFMSIVSCIQQFAMASGSYVAGLIVVNQGNHLMNYSIVGYMSMASGLIALALSRKLHTV